MRESPPYRERVVHLPGRSGRGTHLEGDGRRRGGLEVEALVDHGGSAAVELPADAVPPLPAPSPSQSGSFGAPRRTADCSHLRQQLPGLEAPRPRPRRRAAGLARRRHAWTRPGHPGRRPSGGLDRCGEPHARGIGRPHLSPAGQRRLALQDAGSRAARRVPCVGGEDGALRAGSRGATLREGRALEREGAPGAPSGRGVPGGRAPEGREGFVPTKRATQSL